MGLDVDQVFGVAGSSLQLCRVDSYDYVLGEDGGPAIDVNGRPIPSGLLNVTMLDNSGTREGVPFAIPSGNSAFMGSLPELDAIGIVGWKSQLQPIIIAFLPPGLEGVTAGRGTIPALQPGEALMQASTADLTVDGREERFVGASVKLDSYGRAIVTAEGYKLTIGYMLSNEFTADTTSVLDPITGQAIYLQETLPGGVSRRVDNDGSAVWTYGKHKYERVGQNLDVQVGGAATTEVAGGQTYKDRKNNSFGLDADGNFSANLATGGVTLDSQAGHTFRAGGPVTRQTTKGLREAVGGNMDLRVVQALTRFAALENQTVLGALNVIVGGILAQTAIGAMNLTAGGAMTMIAPQVLAGGAIPLAQAPALIAVLQALIAAIQTGVNAGGPVVFVGLPAVSSALAGIATTITKGA